MSAMRVWSFFAPVHISRFEAMAALLGDTPLVTVEPYAVQGDIVLFYIKGEAATVLGLDQVFRAVRNVLMLPLEEGEGVSAS